MKTPWRILLIAALVLGGATTAFAKVTTAACSAGTSSDPKTLVIDYQHQAPKSTTNKETFVLCGVNVFRYVAALQTQVTEASAPSNPFLPPSGGAGGQGAASTSQSAQNLNNVIAEVKGLKFKAGLISPSNADQIQSFFAGWQQKVLDLAAHAEILSQSDSQLVAIISCYSNVAANHPNVLLSPSEINSINSEVGPCKTMPLPAAKDEATGDIVTKDINALNDLSSKLSDQELTQEYKDWLGPAGADHDAKAAAWTALSTTNAATLKLLDSLVVKDTLAAFNNDLQSEQDWVKRAAAEAADGAGNSVTNATCPIEWFGKTASLTVTLPYLDYGKSPATASTAAVFTITDSCVAPLTVSSGLALSFKDTHTYGFEPSPNATTTTTSTSPAQIIGFATNARVTPLFVSQLNYKLAESPGGLGIHASVGAGIGSSGTGTNTDFLAGIAVSCFHRAVFFTPALHLTQRQSLMSGYALGNPQGSLTTVPTYQSWKTGVAFTISFPVLK